MGWRVRGYFSWRRDLTVQWAVLLVAALLLEGCATAPLTDPLPSWNEGPTKAVIVRLIEDTTRDDGPGKAVGIDHAIGRIPIASFGNSDGDIAMLQTATNSPASRQRKRFAAFVWHTDGAREYAYDRATHVGRLDEGLGLAPRLGWTLIGMKNDRRVIFPYELAR